MSLTPLQQAAKDGNLEEMKRLREQGAPWDTEVVQQGVIGNQIECVRFAMSNGCPAKIESAYLAESLYHTKIYLYLRSKFCYTCRIRLTHVLEGDTSSLCPFCEKEVYEENFDTSEQPGFTDMFGNVDDF